jgi:hypothetical protein
VPAGLNAGGLRVTPACQLEIKVLDISVLGLDGLSAGLEISTGRMCVAVRIIGKIRAAIF